MEDKLTKQDKIFVKEIVETGNKTQAAKKAYKYKDNNVAGVMAQRKLRNVKIIDAIQSIADQLPDEDLVRVHKESLNATVLDHMVFPLGPKNEVDKIAFEEAEKIKAVKAGRVWLKVDLLTDEDIKEMLQSVNCVLRKIVHGEQARHAYFWAYDNVARDKALDKAYKLKGSYAPDRNVNLNLDIDDTFTKDEKEALLKLLE